MTSEKTNKKILQVVNLAPSETWIEKIVYVHPMKQITIASIVQATVFGLMLVMFWVNSLLL